jgi:Tfp pilus assembly protein FimT
VRNKIHKIQHTLRDEAGFTILETLVIVAIVGVLSTMAIAGFKSMNGQAKADGAIGTTLNTLRIARDRAIAERRNFEVHFILPNQIEIIREDIPAGTTVISDTYLESGLKFMALSGVGDTPDAFGGTAPIAFTATTMMFTSEGTFVDQTGDPTNGTLFIGNPGDFTSARAITILGTTALVHPWRYDGRRWID